MTTQSLGFEVKLSLAYEAAVETTRAALKQEGFGVLTEIDLQAAFKEKLGRDFHPFIILGACNPPLAYAAINADPNVSLLLPCNVSVESLGPSSAVVRLTDPPALLGSAGTALSPELQTVANDARARMERVVQALGRTGRKGA